MICRLRRAGSMAACPPPQPSRPLRRRMRAGARGVALVAVLWMVAALTVVVSNLAFTVRNEAHSAHMMLDRARASALLQGALNMAVIELAVGDRAALSDSARAYAPSGHEIQVEIIGAGGLLGLNVARTEQLERLFAQSTGVGEARARELTERVLTWRNGRDAAGGSALAAQYRAAGLDHGPRRGAFMIEDDLTQVIGVDAGVYDNIRGLITALDVSGVINLRTAPEAVLRALLPQDPDGARRIVVAREAGEGSLLGLADFGDTTVGEWDEEMFMLRASLELSGSRWQQVAWVDLRTRRGAAATPGRMRLDPVRVVPRAP